MRHSQSSRQAERRCLYTAESYQQALEAQQSDRTLIPAAVGPQQHYEARLFEAVVDSARDFTERPFGICSVRPGKASVTLRLESAERATDLLRLVLPSYSDEDGRQGLAGSRIRQRTRRGIEIAGVHGQASVWLTGLSSAEWTRAEADIAEECSETGYRPLWQEPSWTAEAERAIDLDPADAERNRRWDAYVNHGAWCASGLLRRVALFHTVTTADLVTCMRAAPCIIGYPGLGLVRWAFELDRRPGLPDSQQTLITALTDPDFGLPLRRVPFHIPFYDNLPHYARIGDEADTALIELRSSEIAYRSLEGRPPWGDPVRFAEMGRAIRRRVDKVLDSRPTMG
ncbi:hypothetical protein OG239_41700 [Streptomyces sp. NBC_00868]|uniref:hypothetical protein n=1 Tax=unclassified Streptomyces TaxID=2593676 RepID=UPI00324939A4|nr:hypothetical protein OG239_41700 [Streptomyces sp. NBC_00868]